MHKVSSGVRTSPTSDQMWCWCTSCGAGVARSAYMRKCIASAEAMLHRRRGQQIGIGSAAFRAFPDAQAPGLTWPTLTFDNRMSILSR